MPLLPSYLARNRQAQSKCAPQGLRVMTNGGTTMLPSSGTGRLYLNIWPILQPLSRTLQEKVSRLQLPHLEQVRSASLQITTSRRVEEHRSVTVRSLLRLPRWNPHMYFPVLCFFSSHAHSLSVSGSLEKGSRYLFASCQRKAGTGGQRCVVTAPTDNFWGGPERDKAATTLYSRDEGIYLG
jgi:hypothetical protein